MVDQFLLGILEVLKMILADRKYDLNKQHRKFSFRKKSKRIVQRK